MDARKVLTGVPAALPSTERHKEPREKPRDPGRPRSRSEPAEAVRANGPDLLGPFQALESHGRAHNLGHVARESQFHWGEVENPNLRPDLAFISFERWAAYRKVPTALTWHVVPDLVVEFITEDEKTEEFGTRLDDYFKAGVSRVWVVYPELRIFDYKSPSEYQILSRDQSIDGGAILPGFQIPIKELAQKRSDGEDIFRTETAPTLRYSRVLTFAKISSMTESGSAARSCRRRGPRQSIFFT